MSSRILFFAFVGINCIILVKAFTNILITAGHLSFSNDSFFDKHRSYDGGLKRYNETFNVFPARWVVLKDFPEDTTLITDIVRTAEDGSQDRLETLIFKICDLDDENREYLPDFLIELTADGYCIGKGDYEFEHAGQVKIEKLLKKSAIDGYRFEAFNVLSSSAGVLKVAEFESEPV